MQPYTVCTILLFFAVIINLFTRNRIAVYYTLFPALLAIFLMLLFNDYGPDIQAYKRFYAEIVPEIFWERGIDLGYAAIMAFVKILGGEFYMFLALVNIMALALIFNVFDRYSPYIALSWLLYFSLYIGYNHTILRQGIALSFTIYSFQYIIEKKMCKYLIMIMLGFLCHSAALLFLPAYWIANIKCTNKTMLFLLVLFFPLVLIDTSAVIAKLISYGGLNEDVASSYFSSSSHSFERAGLSLGLGVRILYFVFFASVYNCEDSIQHVLFNLYGFYLLLYFPLASVSMLSARGLDFFKVLECIMLPYAILKASNIYYKAIITLFVLAYNLYAIPKQYSFLEVTMESALQNIINVF